MANFYPDDLIADVVSANDIVDTIGRYVHLKRSGRGYMGLCPFHKEKTPSFHVSADKQMYHCFGCGAGGTVLQFVMNAENLDFRDALKLLAERAGIQLPEIGVDNSGVQYQKKQRLYDLNREAAKYFHECLISEAGVTALKYLQNRGLTNKMITSFGLGYSLDSWDGCINRLLSKGFSKDLIVESGLAVKNEKNHIYDRFRGRVMFPVFDVRGNIIGFGGRIISGESAKYINSPESIIYNKGKNLFALNFAKNSSLEYIILTEGYMDVISLHQNGITNAIAGCGTALTLDQARLMSRYSKEIYLCYDTDEAGRKACERAADLFSGLDVKLKIISIPEGKDPDEFVRKNGGDMFKRLIEKAKTVLDYRLSVLIKQYNLDDVSQKVEFINKAAILLSSVSNAMERDAYIKELSLRTSISQEAINTEIKKLRAKNERKDTNSELRKAVLTKTVDSGGMVVSGRLNKAEASLINILCSDKNAYIKNKDKLNEDLFSVGLHKEIISIIQKLYSEGKPFDFVSILSCFQGREDEISAVFIKGEVIDNTIAAAADYIEVINEEKLKIKIQNAEKSGDIKLLGELLKEKGKQK